jgi:hypothetical protein
MNRTRAQRREHKRGYTHEVVFLKNSLQLPGGRKPIYLCSPQQHKSYRPHLLPGEVIRPVATTYIHKGRKP